ncbi:sigma-70 family RNA polymerase sigma factor, partial [Streptomyces sp. NPDC013433]|uniref:sigma-70 family RNA polymerase sigma factor n=1 Tax=Streptomyces sp. NPDC013433 TaxID=3155604 RepID=UPI003456F29B
WEVRYSQAIALRQLTDQFHDCESDALYGMLLAIRGWDPDAGDLRPWIRAKVYHQMVDGIRERLGRVRNPKLEEQHRAFNTPLVWSFEYSLGSGVVGTLEELVADPSWGQEFDRVTTVADLARVIPTLTDKQRDLLRAVFWEQITQLEYAERHGTSQAAASHLMKFTLNKIRSSYAVAV